MLDIQLLIQSSQFKSFWFTREKKERNEVGPLHDEYLEEGFYIPLNLKHAMPEKKVGVGLQ